MNNKKQNPPSRIKKDLMVYIWAKLDDWDWDNLNVIQRSKIYSYLDKDEMIIATLTPFISEKDIRVYIKDSIVRHYNDRNKINENKIIEKLSLDISKVKRIIKNKVISYKSDLIVYGEANQFEQLLSKILVYNWTGKKKLYLFNPIGAIDRSVQKRIKNICEKNNIELLIGEV